MFSPNYSSIFKEKELKNDEVPLKSIKSKLIFCQGNFLSSFKDNEMLIHQKAGVHTYNYLPGRPVKDVMFNGIENLFNQSGQQWSTTPINADIRVDVNFKSMYCADFNIIIGYDAITSIIAKVDFYSVKKDSLIYSQEYQGVNTNIYWPQEGLVIVSTGKDNVWRIESGDPHLLRYGKAENTTYYTKKIPFSAGLNSTLLYESVDYSFVNLMSKIGKDPNLKKALEKYLSIIGKKE